MKAEDYFEDTDSTTFLSCHDNDPLGYYSLGTVEYIPEYSEDENSPFEIERQKLLRQMLELKTWADNYWKDVFRLTNN